MRKVPEFPQYSEKPLGELRRLLEWIFNDPRPPIRKEYVSNTASWRVIEWKGYIFLANHGGRTSMSAHVVKGARWDFRETRKAWKEREVRGFSKFPEKSLCPFGDFAEWIFNDHFHP